MAVLKKMASKGSGTIRCGFTGVHMALLEGTITVDIGFDISYAQANPSVTVDFLLPGYQLLARTMFSYMLSCSPT